MKTRIETATAVSPRRWLRLSGVFLLLGAAAALAAPRVDRDDWWVHGLWCVIGLAVALPTLVRIRQISFATVLTDHRLVFLAMFSLFMLFGASLLGLGPEGQMAIALGHYPFDARDALRLAGVNGMGFGVALLMATLARGRWLGARAGRVAEWAGRVPSSWAAGLFLFIGAVATLYRLPYDLGFLTGTVSGSVRQLGQLALAAIFIAASSRGAHERLLRLLAVALATLLAFVGALTFMKSSILFPVIALTAGLAMRFGSRRVLPVGILLTVTLYLGFADLTVYGRRSVAIAGRPATLTERWSYLKEAQEVRADIRDDSRYAWWARLCNVPSEVAALELRDAGNGGNGTRMMWWVFVPRVLAPDKPVMTWGDELYTKITGAVGSADAVGVFASGYYHGGWWGFVFASLICGWIVALTSAVARAVHAHHAVLMLPFSLLGLYIAGEVSGDFVSTYMGLFIFILYPILGAALFLHRPARVSGRPSGAASAAV